MATILEFKCEATECADTSTQDDNAAAPTTSAQIIIFPGVRIERYGDDMFDEDTGAAGQ